MFAQYGGSNLRRKLVKDLLVRDEGFVASQDFPYLGVDPFELLSVILEDSLPYEELPNLLGHLYRLHQESRIPLDKFCPC